MAPANPFASACVRPGALPFLFPPDESIAGLVERLRANHWHGQIVGPHGSGKSTLLAALLPAIEAAGRRVELVRWVGGVMQAEPAAPGPAHGTKPPLLVVDGFEQCGWVARCGWKLRSRALGHGLLVTAHRDVGLPTIYETCVDESLAQRVVDELLGSERGGIAREDVAAALAAQQGNLRDALFQLYDRFEAHRTSSKCNGP